MPDIEDPAPASGRKKRVDAVRNAQVILDAAAAAFVESGIDTPVREIAARAGVGMGTLYRHFPTRGDLIVAVYRHQVEGCAAAADELLASEEEPGQALTEWAELFVDFLVTKHGLADVLHGDPANADTLHRYFVTSLVPAADKLLAKAFPHTTPPVNGYTLLRGIGNLCIGGDERYDTRQAVSIFLSGVMTG